MMGKKRSIIRVVPDGEKGWNVNKGGKTISHHRKKEKAVDQGRHIAHQDSPSQLVIHKQNGQIQTEHTYRNDPHPPEG